jgi:hypothetical protein
VDEFCVFLEHPEAAVQRGSLQIDGAGRVEAGSAIGVREHPFAVAASTELSSPRLEHLVPG